MGLDLTDLVSKTCEVRLKDYDMLLVAANFWVIDGKVTFETANKFIICYFLVRMQSKKILLEPSVTHKLGMSESRRYVIV